jgi:hypothetical protein
MNRSKQINNTNRKERLFSDNFTIELEEAINKTKPKNRLNQTKYSLNLLNTQDP